MTNSIYKMDKQEKKAQLSIRNNFLKWLNIEGLDSALFMVGNMITGKSTVCHLLKRVIDNYDDPKLKFVQKKKQFQYEYDGQINPKATKPLTIYPKLYRIEKTNTNIIEVPSKLYMLEKKRPNLDRLIATVGIAYAAKHAKFLFFVDAKSTSGKLDNWKKSFPQLFDSFEEQFFDEKTLDSMGFVFTKAKPKESDKQAYLSRIPDLCQSFTNEDPRKELYLNLLNAISNNQRVGVFTKFSDQSAAHQQIKAIADVYEHLSYANLVAMKDGESKHLLKKETVELSKDEEILYNNFKQTLELIVNFFADLYLTIFTTNGPTDIKKFLNQRAVSLKAISEKISSQSDKQQGEQSKFLNERFIHLSQLSTGKQENFQSALGKCLFFVDYKQRVLTSESLSYKSLSAMLDVMFEHGFMIKGFEDQFKPLYMELILFSLFETRFGPLIGNFDFKSLFENHSMRRAFCEENQQFVKNSLLNSQFSSNERPDTVKRILSCLDRLFPESQGQDSAIKEKLEQIKQILSMSTFDTSSPEKGIPQIYEQISNLVNVEKLSEKIYANTLDNPQKDIAYMNKLALLLAQMLKNYGRADLCSGIFRDTGNYLEAKECLEIRLRQIKQSRESVQVTEPILMSYIDMLIEMWLPEKAIIQCHQYAQIHKELRPKLFQKMKEIKQKYNQPFSKDFQQKFTGQGVKLFDFFKNYQLLEKIQNLVTELQR